MSGLRFWALFATRCTESEAGSKCFAAGFDYCLGCRLWIARPVLADLVCETPMQLSVSSNQYEALIKPLQSGAGLVVRMALPIEGQTQPGSRAAHDLEDHILMTPGLSCLAYRNFRGLGLFGLRAPGVGVSKLTRLLRARDLKIMGFPGPYRSLGCSETGPPSGPA